MAIRNIVKEGDPVLSKRSREVEVFDEKLSILIDDMIETMNLSKGVGLAAPQVGVLKRVIVVLMDDKIVEIVNPKIIKKLGKQEEVEGCLSCPGEYGITVRPKKVTIEGYDRFGKQVSFSAEDLVARAFCHETDHLDGILFKERVTRMLSPEELE